MRSMKTGFAAVLAFPLVMVTTEPFGSVGQAQSTTAVVERGEDLVPTPQLVREIQHMLAHLGLDPGPADGNPQKRTNHAVQLFNQMHGLPVAELKRGEKVPAEFLALLRDEAARAMPRLAEKPLHGPQKVATQPLIEERPAVKTLTGAIAPASPKPRSQDDVASCNYEPEDFYIGPNRYTPDTFLKEGFDGSVTRAVARLQDRLEESREIADRIGGSALNEVQRQARVLQYFRCRLKSEQGSATEK